MKSPRFLAALILSLATAACHKPVAENTPTAPESAPAESTPAPAKATPTPAPTAKPVAAAATPAPSATPEMAPPGAYYLIVAARVETADGVVGLTPGTGVKLVRPGVYLSTQGEVKLSDNQVTNNMTLARQAKQQYEAGQAAIKTKIAQEKAAEQARQAAAAQANATAAAAAAATTTNASAPVAPATAQRPLGSSLDQAPKQPAGQIFYDNHGHPYYKDANGGHHYF